MDPAERKSRITHHQDELEKLLAECEHTLNILKPKDLDDEWMSVGAHCTTCGASFGWRCKQSPDGVCHYYSEDGQIELINGNKIPVTPDHDSEYETDDCCLFCGMPDERK
jgi:hypothetical protein